MATAAPRRPSEMTPPSPVPPSWIPRPGRPDAAFGLRWLLRLALVVVALAGLGLALPVIAAVDRAAFDATNELGYGPDWVFELLDPHERIYRGLLLVAIVLAFVLRGPWFSLGAAVALMLAATSSYVLLEVIAIATDRPRPQAVLDNVLKPPGADWAQASYPSGHAAVTAAMALALGFTLPAARWPMTIFALLIAWSRVAFGAHFPLDVVAGLLLGYVAATFSVSLVMATGLLPDGRREGWQRPQSTR